MTTLTRSLLSLSFLALGTALLPGRAEACSCMPPGFTSFMAPEDGATAVPTNTRIWVGGQQTGGGDFSGQTALPIELRDAQGNVVPGDEQELQGAFELVAVFVPDAELTPGENYQVLIGGEVLSTFSVGDGRDDMPPQIPVITSQDNIHESGNFSSCGEAHYANLGVSHGGVLALMDREEESTLDETHPAGILTELVIRDSVTLGNAPCQSSWDEAKRGSKTQVRFSAFDLAGNFSGWSQNETIRIGAENGCSTVAGSPALALLLVGALAVRRRLR